MPPATTTRVVAARRRAALRTTVRVATAPSHEHLHLTGLKPQLNACHLPGTLDAKNPTVQVCVTHRARLRHLHHQPGRALELNGNADDLAAFLEERNLPLDDIGRRSLAERILARPPRQGYITVSNALQWRLQYGHAIRNAGEVAGVHDLLR